MTDQSEVHNRLAPEIVNRIVRGVLQHGGDTTDVLVVTETVLIGVVLAIVKLGGDEPVLDVFIEGVKTRLAEIRLKDIPTAGDA